jgi:hypothetical protein
MHTHGTHQLYGTIPTEASKQQQRKGERDDVKKADRQADRPDTLAVST